jgi:hypothetical protein
MKFKFVPSFFGKNITKRLFFLFFAIRKIKGWESLFLETDEL